PCPVPLTKTGSISGALAAKLTLMFELQLTQQRKARIWLNELPDARTKFPVIGERSMDSGKRVIAGVRRAALEVLIPRGPRALYGLLGAELKPNRSDELIVRVLTSCDDSTPFSNSMALSSDEARVGLPEEYSNAVIEGATSQIIKIGGLGPGELEFGCAVHGLVGSAPIVFKWLASCLVQLLWKAESISQQELTEILQTAL